MKTIRYKSEYFTQTVELLKNAKNTVNLQSDDFYKIAELFENAQENEEKLNKLFSKAYTVLALENDIPVGIASMDKDGCVGIFAASEGETFSKACRLLSGDLDRRAAKKELSMLSVFPADGNANLFLGLKYETFDAASGKFGVADDFMLAKKIKLKDKPDLSFDKSKRLVLDPSKKITVEGKASSFPAVFFGLACFFVLLLTVITVTTYDESQFKKFLTFFIIIGLVFAAATGLLIAYLIRGAKLKKKVLSMNVTNGIITGQTGDVIRVRDDGRTTSEFGKIKCTYVDIFYVFYDANGQRREAHFHHKYNGKSPFFYEGQELVIAYNESESFILRKYTLVGNADDKQNGAAAERDCGEDEATDYADSAELSKYVPINGVKRYYVYSASFAAAVVIAFIAALILGIFFAANSDYTYGEALLNFWPFLLFVFVAFGTPAAVFAIIPARANSKYKQLIRQPYVGICDGKLVQSTPTYRSYIKLKFFCEYKADGKIRKISVPKIIAGAMLKKGYYDVKVLHKKSKVNLVVKKGKLPHLLKRFKKNNVI